MRNPLSRNGKSGTVRETSDSLAPNTPQEDSPAPSPGKIVRTDAFDQPVILQQTSLWSRGIVWGIVGVASFVIIWASIARIEEAVPATGKLEPRENVQEIQAPVGGVVEEILVEDGQRVEKGQVLIRFDPRSTEAQRQSLEQILTALQQENQFYRSQLLGAGAPTPEQSLQANIPPEMLQLTADRAALLAENQLYAIQLQGGSVESLSPSQQARLRAGLLESDTRTAAAQLEVAQFQEQLNQVNTQLGSARESLAIDERIERDLGTLVEEGGISRIQFLRQQQQVMESSAEVQRLEQEQQRLEYAISQAQEKLQNTVALTATDLLNRIADNEKRIAEIETRMTSAIRENDKRISETQSNYAQIQVQGQYQELRSPINGVVFDLQAKGPGFVANPSEPILKIVPSEGLVAEVFITNQDIGFVAEGMPVDVRIDSFPFSEFGDIKGELVRIGSDALPPNEVYPFYRFPAEVSLETQYLDVNGREIPLQSGMSVTTNIITRDRTVMSIFTDMFKDKVDSLRTVR